MTEETIEKVRGSGSVVNPSIGATDGPPAAHTTGSLWGTRIRWIADKRGPQDSKTLTQRLNEAYRDDVLEDQEREFLDLTREHFSRLNDE